MVVSQALFLEGPELHLHLHNSGFLPTSFLPPKLVSGKDVMIYHLSAEVTAFISNCQIPSVHVWVCRVGSSHSETLVPRAAGSLPTCAHWPGEWQCGQAPSVLLVEHLTCGLLKDAVASGWTCTTLLFSGERF